MDRILCFVSLQMRALSFKALETVVWETLAIRAISFMVTFFFINCVNDNTAEPKIQYYTDLLLILIYYAHLSRFRVLTLTPMKNSVKKSIIQSRGKVTGLLKGYSFFDSYLMHSSSFSSCATTLPLSLQRCWRGRSGDTLQLFQALVIFPRR